MDEGERRIKNEGDPEREREKRDVSEKCFPFILTTASGRSDLSKIVSSPGVSFPGQLARKSSPSSRWRVIRLIRIKSCACYFTSSCFSFSREKKNSFQTLGDSGDGGDLHRDAGLLSSRSIFPVPCSPPSRQRQLPLTFPQITAVYLRENNPPDYARCLPIFFFHTV